MHMNKFSKPYTYTYVRVYMYIDMLIYIHIIFLSLSLPIYIYIYINNSHLCLYLYSYLYMYFLFNTHIHTYIYIYTCHFITLNRGIPPFHRTSTPPLDRTPQAWLSPAFSTAESSALKAIAWLSQGGFLPMV